LRITNTKYLLSRKTSAIKEREDKAAAAKEKKATQYVFNFPLILYTQVVTEQREF